MKRFILFCLISVISLCGAVEGAAPYRTIQSFSQAVRQKTRLFSTNLLPDTTLYRVCRDAIITTSIEVGGIEVQHRFNTAANDPWYSIPDSVVNVLFASVHGSGGAVYPLKAWYPQFMDVFNLEELTDAGENQTPVAYNFWAGNVELIPTPKRIDTIYLKCFVEHPYIDPTDTSTTNDTIRLKSGYTLAALELACANACVNVQLWDEATKFMELYARRKNELVSVYTRRFDVLPNAKPETGQ